MTQNSGRAKRHLMAIFGQRLQPNEPKADPLGIRGAEPPPAIGGVAMEPQSSTTRSSALFLLRGCSTRRSISGNKCVPFRDQQNHTSTHEPAHFRTPAKFPWVRYVIGNEGNNRPKPNLACDALTLLSPLRLPVPPSRLSLN